MEQIKKEGTEYSTSDKAKSGHSCVWCLATIARLPGQNILYVGPADLGVSASSAQVLSSETCFWEALPHVTLSTVRCLS